MLMKRVPKYQQQYVENYDAHNAETTLSGKLLQRSHILLEKFLPQSFSGEKVLEVGAGSGHH